MKKVLARILYEILAKHLPASHAVLNVGQEGFRHWCVQNFCGGGKLVKMWISKEMPRFPLKYTSEIILA